MARRDSPHSKGQDAMTTRRTRRLSQAELHKRHLDRMGAALIIGCLLVLIGTMVACAFLDAANGVSVSQSLQSAGL
jgi:hypothetical protein